MRFLLFAFVLLAEHVLLAEYFVTSIKFGEPTRCYKPPCFFRSDSHPHPKHAANGRCRSGWTYYEETDACYKTFLWATFDDAERRCRSYGGHLTSIHSDDENAFVVEMSETGYNTTDYKMLTWIGLKQADYPHSEEWTWTDGTDVDFLLWAQNEPNNENGIEHCVQVHSDHMAKGTDRFSEWNDIRCSHTMRSYVCKKRAKH